RGHHRDGLRLARRRAAGGPGDQQPRHSTRDGGHVLLCLDDPGRQSARRSLVRADRPPCPGGLRRARALEATDRDLTTGTPEHATPAHGAADAGEVVHGLGMRKRPSNWSRLLRKGKARLGAGLLIVIVLSAIAAPLISPHDPAKQNVRDKLAPPAWQSGASWDHPLGTDQLGRDMLSRILYGGRVSLLVALFATIAASILGIVLGVLAGYFGGYTDAVIMRIVDVQMAFPSILL